MVFVWAGSRPGVSLALACALAAAFAAGLPRLKVEASVEQALSPSDPRVGEWHEIRENFGVRPMVVAVASVPDLFSPRSLELLRDFGGALAAVEGIERSVGLFDAPGFDPEHGGDPVPGPPALRARGAGGESVRDAILGEPLYRRVFVDELGETAAFFLSLEPERTGERSHRKILQRLEALKAETLEHLPEGSQLAFVGLPISLEATQHYAFWNLTRLGPLAFAAVAAVVLLFFRVAAAVALPVVTGFLSVAATLGFMGHVGFAVSPYLSTVVVLVAVLGCTEDLHILSGYLKARDSGGSHREALAEVGTTQGVALFLTSTTTACSFASIGISDIPGLREFAFTCAFGMAANFLLTVLAAPALLTLCGEGRGGRSQVLGLGRVEAGLRRAVEHRPRRLGLIFAALLAMSLWGASSLEIDTDARRFLRESSEVAIENRDFARRFGGDTPVVVTLETGRHRGALEPDSIRAMRELHGFVEGEGGLAFGHLSLFDAYRRAKHRDREAGVPPESETADLDSFAALAGGGLAEGFLDFDGSRAAITVLVEASSARELLAFERRLLEFARAKLDPAFEVRVSGEAALIAHVCERIPWQLLASLAILTLVVFAFTTMLFRSVRLGLIALVPNVFPVAATFGAMGWMGIPLGLTTFPVACVAFGIAVDDTIHFLSSFREERRRGLHPREAALAAVGRELRPVLATTALVVAGCAVLLLSPMRSTSEGGMIFAIACAAALVADLLLTPLLLASFGGRPGPRG